MVVEEQTYVGWAPIEAPLTVPRDEHWSSFDSSVNAVSFGFVATAILISMFLVMAIFERFLRPTSPSPPSLPLTPDIESQPISKLGYPSPKVSKFLFFIIFLVLGVSKFCFFFFPFAFLVTPLMKDAVFSLWEILLASFSLEWLILFFFGA